MAKHVDYYLSLNSPYSYMGHVRAIQLIREAGADFTLIPINIAVVFPATGGLPVAKRAPQRQAYRLQELQRWSAHLNTPLNLHPAHWPANERLAAGMVMCLQDDGKDAASFAGAVLSAVWAEQRDIADRATLVAIAEAQGHAGEALAESAADSTLDGRWQANSDQAIEKGIFGIPTYAVGEALFWGQDRLDFLARELKS